MKNAMFIKKSFQLVIVTILVVCIIGCSNKRKELAKKTTIEFFTAIKNDDKLKIIDLYPELKDINSYYKSDECFIKEIKVLFDKKISVTVDNSFTNTFGKKSNQTITLFLKPDENNNDLFKIYDSKGLTAYKEDDIYIYAVKTGCIDKNVVLTDQEVEEKLGKARYMLFYYTFAIGMELQLNVTVTSWDLELGYGNSANGKGIVKNNSSFDIPKLKYKITYFDRNNNEVTSDGGYVTYDILKAGGSKSFTFYTSYVGNAYRAKIGLDFDIDMITKYIVEKDYNGNEFEKFQEQEKERKEKEEK